MSKKYKIGSLVFGLLLGLVLYAPVFAQTTTTANSFGGGRGIGKGQMMRRAPGIFGTVSALNGTTLTVTSKGFPGRGMKGGANTTTTTPPTITTQTYTVDASGATVMKAGATSTVATIAVGDTVMVEGTVTGTNVVAKTIRDGVPAVGIRGEKNGNENGNIGSIIEGNGQPIVGGAVSLVSGNTITITNKSNVSYTIDATSAKVEKDGVASTVSAIAVGDNVIAQGTVSGNSVTATSVIDNTKVANNATTTAGTTTNTVPQKKGFFGAIGGFFGRLFGF